MKSQFRVGNSDMETLMGITLAAAMAGIASFVLGLACIVWIIVGSIVLKLWRERKTDREQTLGNPVPERKNPS
jgi:hypothetical protein